MSNIITLKIRQSVKDPIRAGDLRGEILFFTGVRYMRDDISDEPDVPQRDEAELAEAEAMVGHDVERLKA